MRWFLKEYVDYVFHYEIHTFWKSPHSTNAVRMRMHACIMHHAHIDILPHEYVDLWASNALQLATNTNMHVHRMHSSRRRLINCSHVCAPS